MKAYRVLLLSILVSPALAQTDFLKEIAALRGNVFILHGQVIQVLEKGIIVSNATFTPVNVDANGKLVGIGNKTAFPANVYLEIDAHKFVEGTLVDEKLTFDYGSFSYVDTLGASRKVQAVTTNRQHALDYLRTRSEKRP
jgi:hypothetical protein